MDQETALARLCEVHSTLPFPIPKDDPALLQAMSDYALTVTQLIAQQGPNAHCNVVDRDLWSTFSDLFKSDTWKRPHGHWTRDSVLEWLKQL